MAGDAQPGMIAGPAGRRFAETGGPVFSRVWRKERSPWSAVESGPLRTALVLVLAVGGIAGASWWSLGVTRASEPEVLLRIDREQLLLPNGRSCPLERQGCVNALSQLPAGRIRLTTDGTTPLYVTVPVLQLAAAREVAVLLDDGSGPVRLLPRKADPMQSWAKLDPDAPGVRLRIILRADGLWLAAVGGKVLGPDKHGPTVTRRPEGHDFERLDVMLKAVRKRFPELEHTCALLPSLDTPVRDVVRTASVAGATFDDVMTAVP